MRGAGCWAPRINPEQNLSMYATMKKMDHNEVIQYDRLQHKWIEAKKNIEKPNTKYHQYQLPGGENYQETLLTAVNEVENALGQEKSLALQQKHLQDSYDSAVRSFANYQEKYREGLVDISDLISVQTDSFDVQESLVQVKYNRLVNRIDLGLALGLGVSQ